MARRKKQEEISAHTLDEARDYAQQVYIGARKVNVASRDWWQLMLTAIAEQRDPEITWVVRHDDSETMDVDPGLVPRAPIRSSSLPDDDALDQRYETRRQAREAEQRGDYDQEPGESIAQYLERLEGPVGVACGRMLGSLPEGHFLDMLMAATERQTSQFLLIRRWAWALAWCWGVPCARYARAVVAHYEARGMLHHDSRRLTARR